MFDYRESDVNARDPDSGRTPLHFAVENSDCEVVEQLLERGADV
ncbi:MAG: ankyrin repeat domain-containing protein, partial [Gemmatimonadetes bacterium]|nr:ankyrin repeat domain-containing protein [Gemmatimonadota bacterium]MYK52207.1 ankyrin repeat domain-containing protein [Gemmatimonadota bacterium]